MNIAVIGYGYWGPNLVRNFSWLEGCNVKYVCDLSEERLAKVQPMFPNVQKVTTDLNEVLNDPEVDAVAVATPTSGHYPIAKAALEAGKHVLVEKPMTETYAQGKELVELAKEKGLVLMTDHTFVYTGAVKKIKELIDQDEIGDVLYFDSVRVNLGLFQNDVNVIWDLAPHDLSIMGHVIDKRPVAVSAQGMAHMKDQPENIAYLTVFYDDQTIAHVHVNWLSPIKVRQVMIAGSKKMIVWDDNLNVEKIKVYDSGVHLQDSKDEVYKSLVQYRTGDMYAPKLENVEALKVECQHFLDCIEQGKEPMTSGEFGLEIVGILEASERSIKNKGEIINLDSL